MVGPTGLYGWIRSNDARSLALFAGFAVAVQVSLAVVLFVPLAAFDPAHAPLLAWGGYLERYVPLFLAGTVLWFGWQMFWHIETVRRALGFRFIDASDEPHLCRLIEPLIVALGLPAPFVGVIESPARNAFACGIGPKKAVVVVTRGLLDGLNDHELACVLGHELAHIRNGDIRLMAAANIFMAGLNRMHGSNPLRFSPVHAVLAVAIPALLPLCLLGGFLGQAALRLGQVSRLMIASAREFIADAEAVQLTRNPGAMASALIKVEHHHRIPSLRHEDDAMMIAGETAGANATHPTMAQRIAALAATTGSMVFNSPHAPDARDWAQSATLSEAEAAALLRRLPEARVLPRISQGAPVNWLGLDRLGAVAALAALGALAGIHWDEIGQPRTLAAKFDVRPIGLIVGTPFVCQLPFFYSPGQCARMTGPDAYRAFEGQKHTLAGWLAEVSRKRAAERGEPIAAPIPAGAEAGPLRRTAYAGQSGLLTGITHEATADGFFPDGQGGLTRDPPQALKLAELEAVGCFPTASGHGIVRDGVRVTPDAGAFLREAEATLIRDASHVQADQDEWLRTYARKRRALLQSAWDRHGAEGLDAARKAYRGKGHADVVASLARRVADPAFAKGQSLLDAATFRTLARNAEGFVPCLSLRPATALAQAHPAR